MNTDIGKSHKGRRENVLGLPVHGLVFLGICPFRKQSASIRVHPRFQLIFSGWERLDRI